MTEGEKILSLMRQADGLFTSVAKLLKTIDDQMQRYDWNFKQNKAIDTSHAIWKPHEWLPQDVFRFYESKPQTHLLSYVAVLLWNRSQDEPFEPLISAGCLNYGIGNPVGNNWQYSFARLHLTHSQRWIDGTVIDVDGSTTLLPGVKTSFRAFQSFAVPLVSIANAEQAELKIVKPLLLLLRDAASCG